MTPDEYAEVIEQLEDIWPDTRAYINADTVYPRFASYPAEYLRDAADRLFAEGSQAAPSLSKLYARVVQANGDAIRDGRQATAVDDLCAGGHLWAVVEWEDRSPDGKRRAVCARPGCSATWEGDTDE